jgi:CRISPR-associated protein Cas2
MRVIVFFDLPVQTAIERRNYSQFRKFLIKNGYLMMQESVYSKICLNGSQVESCKRRLQSNKPPQGLVQILVVTEKQYANMVYLVGSSSHNTLDTDERVVVL